jgi:hypothetical protein
MLDGLVARQIQGTDGYTEFELSDPTAPDLGSQLVLTIILVIGPPDPNALTYLVPRAVFERGHPVHVGALAANEDIAGAMLEILEVMNPHDIAIFLCADSETVQRCLLALEPT